MREIPQCWITGQAAAGAAALAVQQGVAPRDVDVDVAALQSALLAQGVHLRSAVAAAEMAQAAVADPVPALATADG